MTTTDPSTRDHRRVPITSPESRAALLPRKRSAARAWGRIHAALYDRIFATTETRGNAQRRSRLLAEACGDVLEIGAGTGLNLPHYPAGLRSLTLVEPVPAMADQLAARVAGTDARILPARAERLPLPDESIDTVVSVFVLCIVDLPATLAEIRRVLRPGGQLLFLEHVRAPSARLARWQDRLNRPWRAIAVGCNCNIDLQAAIGAGGFTISRIEHAEQEAEIPLVKTLIWGQARPAASTDRVPY